jgi:hypothetical protein
MLGITYTKERNESSKPGYHTQSTCIEGKPIKDVITHILDLLKAYVFIDGLDETDNKSRSIVESEVSELALRVKKSNIIVTTRSGEYHKKIEGFDVFEVSPLTNPQILEIASKWITEPTDFLEQIDKNPFKDTLSRPLTLTHLLIIYLRLGNLPEQPAIIYKRLVFLYLEQWDSQRGIQRTSRYSNFFSERKQEFLSAVAFYLIYKTGSPNISFNSKQLVEVYNSIHERFGLPANEVSEVVREIESHNGIIVETGDGLYEFSHLTFQEYFCANYLVRTPFTEDILNYLKIRPAPIAVTIALSSEPNNWLDQLFLQLKSTSELSSANVQLSEFLRRLYLERPYFQVSGVTGFAILQIALLYFGNNEIKNCLISLLEIYELKSSTKRALSSYAVEYTTPSKSEVSLKINRSNKLSDNLYAPINGYLSIELYNQIIE